MPELFDELIRSVKRKDPDLDETFIIIGMLIERERTNFISSGDIVREMIGDKYADLKLSPDDDRLAVDTLLEYVTTADPPQSGAVNALGYCNETRIVPTMIFLLHKYLTDPTCQNVAQNALNSISITGLHSHLNDDSLRAIQEAATNGMGDVKESAIHSLEHYEVVTKSSDEEPDEENP